MKSLILRAETKKDEKRTPLTPKDAKTLIDANIEVFVEVYKDRIFSDSEYERVGCKIVPTHYWKKAPNESIILGLKELEKESTPISQKHIFFAHAYKGQAGSKEILNRFQAGKGQLFDLEYLQNENNKRIAAFGYWAGYVGAAISLWRYYNPKVTLSSFNSKELLLTCIKKDLKESLPKTIIIGAHGRCGRGALSLFEYFNIKSTKWDHQQTKRGGPFKELTDHDIFINAVLLSEKTKPFIDESIIHKDINLSVIGDVSCDPTSSLNPIPIYSESSNWRSPFINKVINQKEINILSVDNLPSVLPLESSEDFSSQLTPHLIQFMKSVNELPVPWKKSLAFFNSNLSMKKD